MREEPSSKRTHRELRILNSIAEALNSSPTVQQALDRTLALVTKLLGLDTAWIWLLDPETRHFYSGAVRNLPPYLQQPVRMSGKSCWCIEEFLDGTLTAKNIDMMECSRLRPAVREQKTDLTRGLAHHATVPLYFQCEPLGILNITAPAMRRLTPEELRLLSTIAYQLGLAIERARLAVASERLARADERARLARDIHDTLAQSLTAIALQIETALRQLDNGDKQARERLEKALATSRSALDQARSSVTNLRSSPLGGKPLPQAIEALARELTSESGIRVDVRTRGRCELPLQTENELYRIVQEALTNVHRHSGATRAVVEIRCGKRTVAVTVRDNGRGFDAMDSRRGSHGLGVMRERARLAGGTLKIDSGNEGTVVRVAVSLPRKQS